jgi:hypothetical protein
MTCAAGQNQPSPRKAVRQRGCPAGAAAEGAAASIAVALPLEVRFCLQCGARIQASVSALVQPHALAHLPARDDCKANAWVRQGGAEQR